MANQKKLARNRRAKQLAQFKLSSQNSQYIAAISATPGVIYANKIDHYTKTDQSLDNAGRLVFIQKNAHLESFIWHATPEALSQALKFGLIPVEAPTAKAIAALGTYRQKVLSRAYEKGIISNKHEQKEALVSIAQDNLAAYQELERLGNTFNAGTEYIKEKERLKAAIDATITQLDAQKKIISVRLSSLTQFDEEVVSKMETFYRNQINSLMKLQTKIEKASKTKIKAIFDATGTDSIMTRVKTMSIAVLVKMQELNQNITYSRVSLSIMRGDLNSACEDALKILRDHEPDQHNPILKAHQGLYCDSNTSEDKTIPIDFSSLSHDEQKIKSTFRAIAEINGDGIKTEEKIASNKTQRYHLNNTPLLTTRFTKWKTNAKLGYFFARIAAGFLNIFTGTLVGLLIDLPVGFITSLFSGGEYKIASLSSKLVIPVKTNCPKNTKADKLIEQFPVKHYSAGVIIGHKIGTLIGDTFWDMATGVWQSASNLLFHDIEELKADFNTGGWNNNPSQEAINQKFTAVQSQIEIINQKMQAQEQKLTEKEDRVLKKQPITSPPTANFAENNTTTQFALPPYHLNSGEWEDLTNAFANGAISVNETFIHNIHAKHPFVGLIFSVTYLAGGLTVLAPNLIPFLTNQYTIFSQAIGNLMSHGSSSAALASGFTQAKLLAAAYEAGIHGSDSWLATGAKQFEQDPANFIIYGAIAVGIGYTLAEYADIPFLSKYLEEETGSVPEIGWAFAGGKISLLLVELLTKKPESMTANNETLQIKLEQEIKALMPDATSEKITEFQTQLRQQIKNARSQINDNLKIEIQRLRLIYFLQKNQQILPELDSTSKREILSLARQLLTGLENKNARLRSIKEALFPQGKKSIITRTLTLITDYIPLLVRCALSPITATLAPWRDLQNKLVKDLTRVVHAVTKLINLFAQTFVRVLIRGPADVLANEIAARLEGFTRNNHHALSAETYATTMSYEKSMSLMREVMSEPVDVMRHAVTAPAMSTVFTQTQRETVSTADFRQNFFGKLPANDERDNVRDSPRSTSQSYI